jgi:uncharacterized repeat protein (TIGR02543 family)
MIIMPKPKQLLFLLFVGILILTTMGSAYAASNKIDINEKDTSDTESLEYYTINGADVVSIDSTTGDEVKFSDGKIRNERTFDIILSENTDPNGTVYIKFSLTSELGPPLIILPELSGNLYNIHDEVYGKYFKTGIPVELSKGIGLRILNIHYYDHWNVANSPAVTHTFNFTVEEIDASGDPDPSEVESITVTNPPNRTEYFLGDTFRQFGMEVTATLKAGGTAVVKDFTIQAETDPFTALGDQEVEIAFGSHTATTPVRVLQSLTLGSMTVENGQRLGDWTSTSWFPSGPEGFARKPETRIDAVIWHGEAKGRFTFTVPGGVTVSVGGVPQTITEDPETGDRICTLNLDTSVTGAKAVVRLTDTSNNTKNYDFTCYSQNFSGMPNNVVDYFPIAGQWTNAKFSGPYAISPEGTLRGYGMIDTTSGGIDASPKSLGNFGGYITYYYENAIKDDEKNPYGIDFIVYGNSWDGTNAFAEPGNVYVSRDGETWYTLAGSLHYDDNALWPYSITYTKDSNTGTSKWVDSRGKSGTGDAYPRKEFYPLHDWTGGDETSVTLHGVGLVPESEVNVHGNTEPPYPHFGYADVGKNAPYIEGPNKANNNALNPYTGIKWITEGPSLNRWMAVNDRYDEFDLKWAVDYETGQPVSLPDGIHYIKIQCANNINSGGGGIGEKSSEIHTMRVAAPAGSAVGKTAAPTVKINGSPVTLADGTPVNAPVSGAFIVNVETDAENVYINGARTKSATFARIPNHEMLRVIVQDGNKEPWIGYVNLTEGSGEASKFSEITFDPAGGVVGGALKRTYLPAMEEDEKVFPIPARFGYTFGGWSAQGWNNPAKYDENMPETLTLTAQWQYNAPAVNSGAGYGAVATADSERPGIILSPSNLTSLPQSVRVLPESSPYGAATEDAEIGNTYSAITDVLKWAEVDNVSKVYVTDAYEVLIKGMDDTVRSSLGLDSLSNKKLLPLPVFEAYTQQPGDTVLVSVKVTFGAAFAGTKLGSVVPLKLKPDGTTTTLIPQSDPKNIKHGEYAWTDSDGAPLSETKEIIMNQDAYLNVAIKDDSDLDWDNQTTHTVIDPIILANGSTREDDSTPASGGSGYEAGGGCDAGLGLTVIGVLLGTAILLRRGRRTK